MAGGTKLPIFPSVDFNPFIYLFFNFSSGATLYHRLKLFKMNVSTLNSHVVDLLVTLLK